MTKLAPLKPQGREQLDRILWMSFFAQGIGGRRGLPFVLVGDPGVGKTSRVKQITRRAGMYFEGLVASLRAPSDFLGLPIPAKLPIGKHNQHLDPSMDKEFLTITEMAPPGFAVRAAQAKNAVLLLDEVNTARPAVQAALLRLLFEGVAGEMELPPGVRFLLAMNETEDAAGGWDIALPLANRMGWLKVDPPTPERFNEVIMGSVQRDEAPVDPIAEEAAVDARWPDAYAEAAGIIGGFLMAKSNMLLVKPKASSRQGAGPWPSPRSYEFAIRALAGCMVYGMSGKDQDEVISAFVGAGASGELHTWRRHNDLPNPADFLDGVVPFVHMPARLDRTAAVLTSCTTLVTPENAHNRQARAEALWAFHETLADQAADLALGSVVSMCNAKLMLGSKRAYKVLARMEPVMTAAGITPESAQ